MGGVRDYIWEAYVQAASAILDSAGFPKRQKGFPIKRILIYHNIDKHSISSFKKQIEYYAANFRVLSLRDFIEGLAGDNKEGEDLLSITFDDAYRSVYKNGAGVLDALCIKPCIFIPFGFIETPTKSAYMRYNIKSNICDEPMAWYELTELMARGYEVGSHSWSHVDLGKEGVDFERELLESKLKLQEKLDAQIKYFAFPFGRKNNITQQGLDKAREYGYNRVFSGERMNITGNDFLLPRTYINPYWRLSVVKRTLEGHFDK